MKCSFCGKNLFKFGIKKYSSLQQREINYLKCKYCGSMIQHPIPENKLLQKYYDSYKKIKKEMNPGYLNKSNLKLFFKERDLTLKEIKFNNFYLNNTNNVELGCANGNFLNYLNKKGAKNIIGIDISKNLIKNINLKNVKVILGDLSKIKPKNIDNLYLFNILEHLVNIKKTMKLIRSRVKVNSRLIIEVPLAGFISKNFKSKWRFFMPDEHLHIPSLKGLKTLLQKNGFKIVGQTRFGSGFTLGSIPYSFKVIIDFFVKLFKFGDRGTFHCIYVRK